MILGGVTADQQTKVKAIIEETHQQMRTTMNDQSLSKEAKQAKMKQMHESVQSKVNAVLTPEQKAAWRKALEPVYSEMASRVGKDTIAEFQKEANSATH